MSTLEKIDPDFPLTKHPRGYYCKRILGKLHYFGKRNADKSKHFATTTLSDRIWKMALNHQSLVVFKLRKRLTGF